MKVLATLAVINGLHGQNITEIEDGPFEGTADPNTRDEIGVANQAEITDFYVKPSDVRNTFFNLFS